jgi:hypothetical protein
MVSKLLGEKTKAFQPGNQSEDELRNPKANQYLSAGGDKVEIQSLHSTTTSQNQVFDFFSSSRLTFSPYDPTTLCCACFSFHPIFLNCALDKLFW